VSCFFLVYSVIISKLPRLHRIEWGGGDVGGSGRGPFSRSVLSNIWLENLKKAKTNFKVSPPPNS
jgi:hypothetical protein